MALIASEHTVCEYPAFLQYLLVGLADESIPVALVSPPEWDSSSVFTSAAEVIAHPVIDMPLVGPLNTRLLAERLMRFKPTVLHCLCESGASVTRQLAHRLDVPYVLAVNSLGRRWSRLSVSPTHCAKIIVPAKSIAANVAGVHPRLADRIEQINMGTFAEETATCFSEPSHLATLMTAHRFENVDECENLLGVARHLLIEDYEFMMVIVGSGRADRKLWKLLAALGLLNIVTLVPRGMPWHSLLASADIFIRPQPRYVFDPQLLGAMSVGAAVAGCRGGVDDLIIEEQTALVFDPNDENSILRTLREFLDRRERARQMAGAALDYLRKNHSVSGMISATLQVYRGANG
ncbi:MAG: hypothetical protein A2Z25_11165 [Planctomycetes bacterium RBG_16_55_9]|nr:MAG: hypothetical protein A2Z25_11165 [Planctomycetes bacterium RBG_16_55_9]